MDCISCVFSSGTIHSTSVINDIKDGISSLKLNEIELIGFSIFKFDNTGSFMLYRFVISTVADCKNCLHLK